jgi:hypothetical protein
MLQTCTNIHAVLKTRTQIRCAVLTCTHTSAYTCAYIAVTNFMNSVLYFMLCYSCVHTLSQHQSQQPSQLFAPQQVQQSPAHSSLPSLAPNSSNGFIGASLAGGSTVAAGSSTRFTGAGTFFGSQHAPAPPAPALVAPVPLRPCAALPAALAPDDFALQPEADQQVRSSALLRVLVHNLWPALMLLVLLLW